MERKNAVIVAYGRSGIAKAIKGSLRYTGCADYGTQVLKGILAKNPNFDPAVAGSKALTGCELHPGAARYYTEMGYAAN